ncbi:MAG: hypothetical protein U1F56_01835 [Rubrivivax sp.]
MIAERCTALAAPASVAEARRKRLDTLRAKLGLRDYELRQTETGALLVVRWALSRELPDIDAAETFAHQVGAV